MLDIVSNYIEELFSFSVQYNQKKKIHVECIQCTVAIKVSFLVDIKCI